MIAIVANDASSRPSKDQLLSKIRPGLLALKQFEPTYVLAKWIRDYFMDNLERSAGRADANTPRADNMTVNSHAMQLKTPESMPADMASSSALFSGMHAPGDAASLSASAQHPSMGDEPSSAFNTSTYQGSQVLEESTREGSAFWPAYLANGFCPNTRTGDVMDFSQSDTSQYQALYFLANLGFSNSERP